MWRQTFHYSQIHYCYLICVGWWNAYHADCITLQSTIEAVGTCYIKLSMKWILKGKWISSKITLPFTLRNHFWKGKSSNETVSSPLWVEQLSLWTFLQESAVIHALRFLLSFGSLRKQLGVFHADTVNFGDTELHVFSVNFPLILPSPPPPLPNFATAQKGFAHESGSLALLRPRGSREFDGFESSQRTRWASRQGIHGATSRSRRPWWHVGVLEAFQSAHECHWRVTARRAGRMVRRRSVQMTSQLRHGSLHSLASTFSAAKTCSCRASFEITTEDSTAHNDMFIYDPIKWRKRLAVRRVIEGFHDQYWGIFVELHERLFDYLLINVY